VNDKEPELRPPRRSMPCSAPPPFPRMGWSDAPERVRRAVTDSVGSPIVSAQTPPGGFTPGVAARLLLADGRRCFVKVASASFGEWVRTAYRHEASINIHLPAAVPAPRMWSVIDDGDWVCLIFDDVPGRFPSPSWNGDDLPRVLEAMDLSARALTPNPIPIAASVRDAFAAVLGGSWQRLQDDPALAEADPWAARHLTDLIAREPHWNDGVDGTTLLHLDLRRDNILLTPTEVMFVDWAWPAVGAAWLDLACFLPTVAAQAACFDVDAVFRSRHAARTASAKAVDAFLVALAGYWRSNSLLPAPSYAPLLRREQQLAADGAIRWLRTRAKAWTGEAG
jgi:aminoglycoside phosphotransferase